MNYCDFGLNVRTELLKHGKTISWLAKELNISTAYVSEILKGTRKPEVKIEEIQKRLEQLNRGEAV